MKKLLLVLLCILSLPFVSNARYFADDADLIYVLFDGESRKIPKSYVWYNERLSKNTPPATLEQSSNWSNELKREQSYISGFWMRYHLRNDTSIADWGLDHENLYTTTHAVKRKYYTNPRLQIGRPDDDGRRYFLDVQTFHKPDERVGFLSQVTVSGSFYDNVKVKLRPGEEMMVFEWVQMDHFNRWHGKNNPVERVHIQEWNELLLDKHKVILFKFIFTVFIFGFCVIFFIHLLLDFSLNYFWMFLTAISTVALFVLTEIGLGFYIGMPKFFTISETYTIFICIALAAYSQFVYSLLQSDEKLNDRRIAWFHYSYQTILAFVIIISSIELLYWPSESVTDLTKHPLVDVGFGPGFIPARLFFVSYAFWLFPMILISMWCIIRRGIIAIYALIAMSMLMVMCVKYAVFMLVVNIDHEMLKTVFADEIILATLFSMIAFTASARIRKTEMDYLSAQLSLKEAYARFVPEELTEHLQRKRIDLVELGDQKEMNMSILFSDIRGFTTMSEKMTPDENFQFINSYLKVMTPLVKYNNGFVSSFIGDAIMALFDRKVEDAIETAIAMMRELRNFNREREKNGLEPINHGIGINSGKLILGTLGDEERMEASVISNSVNVAARLETLTKTYQVPVLLSADTVATLPERRYSVRKLDKVAMKGKKEETEIWELLDAYSEDELFIKQRNLPLWRKAMEAFEEDDHETAGTFFKGIHVEDPTDFPAAVYADKCADRRKTKDRRSEFRLPTFGDEPLISTSKL